MNNQNMPNQDPDINNSYTNQAIQNQNMNQNANLNTNQNMGQNNKKNLKADTVNKKKKYKYVIQNAKGKKINGYLDAYTKKEVASYLQNEGYNVLKVDEQSSILSMELGNRKLSYAELAFLLTQLYTYLKAGIPLIDSIKILEKQGKF